MTPTINLLAELQGTLCRCGKPKYAFRTFCPSCYRRLPRHFAQALYSAIDAGYSEAYEKCVEFLDADAVTRYVRRPKEVA